SGLPNYMFRPRIAKMKRLALSAVREIKEEFNASLTATLLKLVEADRFPIMVVCHNKANRRWFRRADMLPGWWFPKDDLDPESIAFEMLFGGAAEISYARQSRCGSVVRVSRRGSVRHSGTGLPASKR